MKIRNIVSLREKYLLTNSRLKIAHYIFNIASSLIILATFSANQFNVSTILSLIILIGFMILVNKLLLYVRSKYGQELYIRNQLLYVLSTNKLFNSGTDSEGNTQIILSGILSFFIEKEKITIRAHLRGDSFSKKLKEIELELSSALGIELEKTQETSPQFFDYVFLKEKKEVAQFVYTSALNKEAFEHIPLDEIMLTQNQSFSLKKNSNMSLYGRTGAGKTVALQWYLYNAVSKGCGTDSQTLLSIVDGKEADLYALGKLLKEELTGSVSVGSSPTSLAKLSREFVDAMDTRFELIKHNASLNADAYDLGLTPNFLFVDELASIRDSCGSSKKGKELWNEILQNIGLIARKGRQAGCHLCLSTQDPNAENIPVELRNQISSVIYLGSAGTDRVRMAFSMCELKQVPTVSGRKGEALFYADGLNIIEPEITIIPFVDVKTKRDFISVIRNIKPDANNFV